MVRKIDAGVVLFQLFVAALRGSQRVVAIADGEDHRGALEAGVLLANGGSVLGHYIHDDDALIGFAKQENAIGFLLPAMEKSQLFRGVIADGVLPRKTFSMGHSREKRYYLEGRKIKA